MNVGDKILELRKSKGYSQEDIANKLNVSRQTISKWETNQSTPDFDKIVPLCQLFGISTDELLINKNIESKKDENGLNVQEIDINLIYKNKRKFAINLCISIFLYFMSVMWIILAEGLRIKEEFSIVVFLGVAGVATVLIIYTSIVHSNSKKELNKYTESMEKNVNPTVKTIKDILALVVFIIYFIISFATMAWHLTWILWVVYSVIVEIIELLFKLKETK